MNAAPVVTWSDQQEAIFEWFRTSTVPELVKTSRSVRRVRRQILSLVARARAGTGKTTTIVEAVRYAPEARILVAAFNKRIAMELKKRLTESNPNATAQTLHSVGLAIVRENWERMHICERGWERGDALTQRVCGDQTPDAIKKLVTKLHGKGREILPHARKAGDLIELAYQFECDPEPKWLDAGYDVQKIERWALAAMDAAAKTKPAEGIDFADMIFLPVRNRWFRPLYDLVVVDEGQDMTTAQLELAQGVCAGRFCIVGDDRQAIYGFRGADSDSLDRLKVQLGAAELGLTTTYRCGKAIVAVAKALVPDFEAGEHNPEGEVLTMGVDRMLDQSAAGDFILSRINAPLASHALALIRRRKRVRIAGKDIGRTLGTIVRKIVNGSGVQDIPTFLEKLQVWATQEVERAYKAKREERVEQIGDQRATLEALTDGAADVRELEARIEELFSDTVGEQGYIQCSSVHKAKGLEAERVFVLKDTLYPKRPKAAGNGRTKAPKHVEMAQREEQNIEYVAVTRAKRTLVWVLEAFVEETTPTSSAVSVEGKAIAKPGGPRIVDASELGLAPGRWPERVLYNGESWYRHTAEIVDGEIVAYDYEIEDIAGGQFLRILND